MKILIFCLAFFTGLTLHASKVVSGSVLLRNAGFPDSKSLLAGIRNNWNIRTDSLSVKDKTIVFSTQGATVMLAFLDYPAPQNEVQTAAAISWLWKSALEESIGHQAQVVVSVIGADGKSLDLYKLFTKVTAGVLEQTDAIGVLLSEQLVISSRGYFIESAKNMNDQALPLHCWIYFGLVDENGDTGVFTFGLKEFGLPEMEIVHTKRPLSEAQSVLAEAAQYVVLYNVTLKEGQSIPLNGMKLKAGFSPAVYLNEGSSVKIAY